MLEFEPIIASIAYRYRKFGEQDDLMQLGRMAALRAIRDWDVTRGVALKTVVFEYVRRDLLKVGRALRQPKRNAVVRSLDETAQGHQERTLGELIRSNHTEAEHIGDLIDAKRMLDKLDERSREILLARADGEDLAEIGKRLGISRQRVEQIQNRELKPKAAPHSSCLLCGADLGPRGRGRPRKYCNKERSCNTK